jgi:hypothetical protein
MTPSRFVSRRAWHATTHRRSGAAATNVNASAVPHVAVSGGSSADAAFVFAPGARVAATGCGGLTATGGIGGAIRDGDSGAFDGGSAPAVLQAMTHAVMSVNDAERGTQCNPSSFPQQLSDQ